MPQMLPLPSNSPINLNIIIFFIVMGIYGQYTFNNGIVQYNGFPDAFEKELCRERWYRLDWKYILRPCLGRINFGSNNLPSSLATSSTMSRIVKMDIKNAGDYSTLIIHTFDISGRTKVIGGDTWRVFLEGPSSLQPLVHDMGNGFYEIPFLIMEPGLYTAEIFLEGTLCSQFVDPPLDWFQKGDYNGHFQEAHMYKHKNGWPYMLRKRLWERIGGNGSTIQFYIHPRDEFRYQANMEKLGNWENICNIPKSCNFIWDGFGRWIGNEWKPYSDDDVAMAKRPKWQEIARAKRRRRGTLMFYGDCFAHHLYEMEWNMTLCRSVFKECLEKYNWVYPRLHPIHELDPSLHRKDSSDISINKIISYLQEALGKTQMNKDSVVIANYGLHLARSTSFEKYKQLISQVISVFAKYKGEAIWKTTTSIWRPQEKVHKRFQTYQRIQLFNAFSMSSMCNAGIPILDVFPMTSSTSQQPTDSIHYDNEIFLPLENALINYFKDDD